jgi:anti-sigma regulatory factor (Ser/Thr protein kinase)
MCVFPGGGEMALSYNVFCPSIQDPCNVKRKCKDDKVMPMLTLPAHMSSLTPGIAFVSACAAAAGLPPQRLAAIELAVEEALVNICQYAYGHNTGNVEVHWSQDTPPLFVITLIDFAIPFNVSTMPSPDLDASLEDRQVGGLGIVLSVPSALWVQF